MSSRPRTLAKDLGALLTTKLTGVWYDKWLKTVLEHCKDNAEKYKCLRDGRNVAYGRLHENRLYRQRFTVSVKSGLSPNRYSQRISAVPQGQAAQYRNAKYTQTVPQDIDHSQSFGRIVKSCQM